MKQQEHEDDQTRVEPLGAGVEGRDLPRDNNEPSSSLPSGSGSELSEFSWVYQLSFREATDLLSHVMSRIYGRALR